MIRPAASVDKYQTVAFDCNRYSVPRPFADQLVTVKGYVDRVVIVAAGQVIATHVRSLKRGTVDPGADPLSRNSGPQARSTRPRARVPGLEASGLLRRRSVPSWNNIHGA